VNELETVNRTLPDTLPELSKFVLIGREKLNAVRAEIRAIEKVGLAKEVLEQKRVEAQEIAELVTMSEMQIGRMMKEIPKATKDNAKKQIAPQDKLISKSETIRELGFTPKQTAQFQQMAGHEPQVLEAIAEARERDDIVSRADVMRKIETVKKPHVTNNGKDDEWYTPAKYIESAREVLGRIDLDPASNDFANKTVKADRYFTEESNGLEQEWSGNIWMNPPYSTALLSQFADKLISSNFSQAIVLVNNATETAWFEKMISKASAIVFHKGRIRFVKRDGEHGAPLQGQAFIYYGDNAERFLEVFSKYGWGARL
jgi:ParB family chromosome partitioning protein